MFHLTAPSDDKTDCIHHRTWIWALVTFSAAASALTIQCGESSLPGGGGPVPFIQVLLEGENCDHFQNTAGRCADETKAGPLKGPGKCDGAYYWFTGGNMNVELSDGSHHYCVPESGVRIAFSTVAISAMSWFLF